ncbi:hypothetical protein Pelo_2116 [Pelomyxa schiedti]|nr:hypothetical protein Pelo_2116 [Pelomyxa schiedti]
MCVAWVDDVTAVEKSLYTNPHAVLLPTRNGEVVTSQLLGIRWDWDDASATLIANRRWVVALSYGSLFMWKVVPLGDDFGGARRRTTVDYKSEKVVGVGPGKAYSDVGVWQFTRCPRDKGSEVGDVLSIGLFRNGRLDYMQVIFSQNSIECSHGMKRLVFPGGLQQGKECIVDGSFIRDISTGEKHMEFPPESVVYAVDDTHVGVVRLDHNVFPLAVFEVYNLENSASCCSEAQAIHSGIKYKETESGGGLFLKCTTTMPTVQVVDAFTGVVVFQMKRCDAANFTLHVQDLS